jgi:hypothetical protein
MRHSELVSSSFRADVNGWHYLNLVGSPLERGYQHGYYMAKEIKNFIDRANLWSSHTFGKGWSFFKQSAKKLYMSKIPGEYREEIEGVARGANARGIRLDYVDVLALNGFWDTVSYIFYLSSKQLGSRAIPQPGCSAFIATGSATKNREIVIAHNEWYAYLIDESANVFAHVVPEEGCELWLQMRPGFIASGIDFMINSAGLMVTSTSITGVTTFNPTGVPWFVRLREATQYSRHIDSWVKTMIKDNNGGLSNQYMIGDYKTGQIALFELATFSQHVEKKTEGYFMGSNLAYDSEIRKETAFDYNDMSASPCSRNAELRQILQRHTGQIDVELAKRVLANHYDTSSDADKPSARTLCGHVELDEKGWLDYGWGPYYPGGTVDAKVTSSSLVRKGASWIKWGKPCGTDFFAKQYLERNSKYQWQSKYLTDLISYPWTLVSQTSISHAS